MIVAGTRPEIIKLVPIMQQLDVFGVEYTLVWSGQHYDYEMSNVFFEQFGVRKADVNLDVRNGTHAEQTAKIMFGLENLVSVQKPTIIVSQGDTNTVLAAALTSAKSSIPFAHVEAGLRSWNMVMPEEINRRVADAIASLHFAPTELAALNLAFEGIPAGNIHVTGNTVVDVIFQYEKQAQEAVQDLLERNDLEVKNYALLTLHRAENVDNHGRLENILKAISEIAKEIPLVFPIHPRTRNRIAQYGLSKYLEHVKVLRPLNYFEFLGLLKNARVVLTDSGGVQEEAFTLKVPTVTLRYNTERPETTMYDINVLAGADTKSIITATMRQAARYEQIKKLCFENPLGDGKAGRRIAECLKRVVNGGIEVKEPDHRNSPLTLYRLLDKPEGEVLAYFKPDGTAKHAPNSTVWKVLARIQSRYS